MFIVAMTLTVLASLGVYALAAAATGVRASGNERQATQTHYLAQYGILGAAQQITGTNAQWFLSTMLNATYSDTSCISLPVPTGQTVMTTGCRRIGSDEMTKMSGWTANLSQASVNYNNTTGYTAPYTAAATPGLLGPSPMVADFFVELTEPTQLKPPARYDLASHLCFIQFVATAEGITQPIIDTNYSLTAAQNATAQYGAEGTELSRARFIAGPIECPR